MASSQKCMEWSQTIWLGACSSPGYMEEFTSETPNLTWVEEFNKALAISGVVSEQVGLIWGQPTAAVCFGTHPWVPSCLGLLTLTWVSGPERVMRKGGHLWELLIVNVKLLAHSKWPINSTYYYFIDFCECRMSYIKMNSWYWAHSRGPINGTIYSKAGLRIPVKCEN